MVFVSFDTSVSQALIQLVILIVPKTIDDDQYEPFCGLLSAKAAQGF